MLVAALATVVISCAQRGETTAKKVHITTSKGAQVEAEDVTLGQDFKYLREDADGSRISLGMETTAVYVHLNGQDKAALIEGLRILETAGAKALATYFTGGASEAVQFLSAAAKARGQLEQPQGNE